ncbi:MAG: 2-oxoacid:acceptor oxidoreductase subunit alpha [Gammaproteobacteria bacterium]|nr:2-oxoacid:acceptor oxidoreductase subunit alpha [Gammaproteobacteria bacterium]
MTSETDRHTSVSVALVGSGGAGVLTAGQLLLQAAARVGLFGLLTRCVGPQIRGGESAALLRLAGAPVHCMGDSFDAVLALDWNNAERFASEIPLRSDSVVISDAGNGKIPDAMLAAHPVMVELPIAATAAAADGGRGNMVALGILSAMLELPAATVQAVIATALADKGAAAVSAGVASVELGRGLADQAGLRLPVHRDVETNPLRWLLTGNEAAGLGALRGGVRFVAAYPITPATEILEWLAPNLQKIGATLVQAEDELASINMCIGASYAGVPALTATSGPGFSLMLEGLGLAVAAEVPLVVIDVMRGGPSTGIPTKSEQTDLNAAVYGMHGEAPHLVLAPTSIADALFTTQWAVHLAESMQTPAIVLSDQAIGQTTAIINPPANVKFFAERAVMRLPQTDYTRYAITADGVSPVTLPGTPGGQYTADGLEHSPRGTPSSRGEDHALQLDKRLRKIASFNYGVHWADVEGDGAMAVITWGSTTGAVREAVRRLRATGRSVRLIALRLLYPAQPRQMAAALSGVTCAVIVEQSHSGQFHRYLRAHYDLPPEVRLIARPGPLVLRPGELAQRIGNRSQ